MRETPRPQWQCVTLIDWLNWYIANHLSCFAIFSRQIWQLVKMLELLHYFITKNTHVHNFKTWPSQKIPMSGHGNMDRVCAHAHITMSTHAYTGRYAYTTWLQDIDNGRSIAYRFLRLVVWCSSCFGMELGQNSDCIEDSPFFSQQCRYSIYLPRHERT